MAGNELAMVENGEPDFGNSKTRLEVSFANLHPGGVGPLTIAMLLSNTVRAAELRHYA